MKSTSYLAVPAIFLLFSFSNHHSSLAKAGPANQAIGSIYNVYSSSGGPGWTSTTLSTDFPVQNVGAAVSGGAITTSLDGAGTFSDSLCFKDTLRSTNVKIVVGVSLTSTQSGTTYGVSLAMKGVNYYAPASIAMFYNMSTSNNGHSQLFYQNNSLSWTQSWGTTTSSAVANATNDRIVLTLERINNQIHWNVYNQTQNLSTFDTTFIFATTGPIYPNTWVPTLFANGGHLKIDSFTVAEGDPVNPDILFYGDSKGIFGQSFWQQTYPAVLGYFYPSVVIQHGFGDLTAHLLSGWPDVKRLMPKMVVYEGGSNDIRFSQSGSTAGNVAAFFDSCAIYGIRVIFLSPIYESNQDLSSQLSIFSKYAPNYIYCFDIGARTGMLYFDGIHLSNAGAQEVARRIRESNLLINPNLNKAFVPNANNPPTFY